MERAYEEIIEFIAAGASSGDVVAFEPSSQSKARVADLVEREKIAGLPICPATIESTVVAREA